MLSNYTGFNKIYITTGFTDLRQGINGLATMLQSKFNISPFQENVLFLFCGRSNSRIKGLVWEGDGFLLLFKRVEAGRYQWPRSEEEVRHISQQQFEWLMRGMSIQPGIHKVSPKSAY